MHLGVLKDLKIWDNADTQLIGRKQTKVFDRKTTRDII